MSKIIHVSDWSEWDELDGERLKNGEKLRIEWPNGRITEEEILIHEGSTYCSDHGHGSWYPATYSYLNKHVNGVPVRVHLAGLTAARV